ncbi:MAG: M55 family metallopeptidase [Halanaerobiaceae bacterium]
MKLYISADIEGVAGAMAWDEVSKNETEYEPCSKQMTREVRAACQGALNGGAEQIWVKDAHGSGRNINIVELPEPTQIIRGWSGSPLSMMQELDETFTAVMMVGYHSRAGSGDSPLAHTFSGKASYIKINDEYMSEFNINAYIASMFELPVIFVSGDEGLCQQVREFNDQIKTVETKSGIGNSVVSIHPDRAVTEIKAGVESALQGKLSEYLVELPDMFRVEISYNSDRHYCAYKASFYPGVKQISPTTVIFETDDYFDVLRLLLFVV